MARSFEMAADHPDTKAISSHTIRMAAKAAAIK
jgi:hypothetical protein